MFSKLKSIKSTHNLCVCNAINDCTNYSECITVNTVFIINTVIKVILMYCLNYLQN